MGVVLGIEAHADAAGREREEGNEKENEETCSELISRAVVTFRAVVTSRHLAD